MVIKLLYPTGTKQIAADRWPGAKRRPRFLADSFMLEGDPAVFPLPKYFLKFYTKSRNMFPSTPIRVRIGARFSGTTAFAKLPEC